MTTHPMHLFDPPQPGSTGKPARSVRLSPTIQNDVFLSALLETGTTGPLFSTWEVLRDAFIRWDFSVHEYQFASAQTAERPRTMRRVQA
jgi:hypothetical protein